MRHGNCSNRAESAPLNDRTKSLVFVNHFGSVPIKKTSCVDNSEELISMLDTCYGAAGNRWANFVAVDYYKVCNSFDYIFTWAFFFFFLLSLMCY